jgi:hypothetical protein
MLRVTYAACHLCCVSLMLNVTCKLFMLCVVMLNVIMLTVTYKPLMLSVIMLCVTYADCHT